MPSARKEEEKVQREKRIYPGYFFVSEGLELRKVLSVHSWQLLNLLCNIVVGSLFWVVMIV